MCLGIESCSTFLQPVSSPGLPAAFSEFGASLLDMEVPSSQRFRRSVASLQDCVGDDPRPQLRLADISEHGRFAGAALLHPGPLPLSIQNQMPSPEGELSPDPKLHKVHRQAYPRRLLWLGVGALTWPCSRPSDMYLPCVGSFPVCSSDHLRSTCLGRAVVTCWVRSFLVNFRMHGFDLECGMSAGVCRRSRR